MPKTKQVHSYVNQWESLEMMLTGCMLPQRLCECQRQCDVDLPSHYFINICIFPDNVCYSDRHVVTHRVEVSMKFKVCTACFGKLDSWFLCKTKIEIRLFILGSAKYKNTSKVYDKKNWRCHSNLHSPWVVQGCTICHALMTVVHGMISYDYAWTHPMKYSHKHHSYIMIQRISDTNLCWRNQLVCNLWLG